MKKTFRQRGLAAMTVLFVVTALGLTAVSLTSLTASSMTRSKRELKAAQAFQAAQSGVEYEYQQLLTSLEATHGTFQSASLSLASSGLALPDGATGTISISPIGSGNSAWITCSAFVGTNNRSVRVLLRAKDVGI